MLPEKSNSKIFIPSLSNIKNDTFPTTLYCFLLTEKKNYT